MTNPTRKLKRKGWWPGMYEGVSQYEKPPADQAPVSKPTSENNTPASMVFYHKYKTAALRRDGGTMRPFRG